MTGDMTMNPFIYTVSPYQRTNHRQSIIFASLLLTTLLLMQGSAEADTPRSIGALELKSGDTVLSVGGSIIMDTTFSWPDGDFTAGEAPLTRTGENAQFYSDLRNSLIWFKTRTPTPYGMLQTLIEMDFQGSDGTETISNSHNPELVHAYFQIGGLTAGQTWSTFTTYITPDTILDPAWVSWIRQPLIRWSHEGDGMSWDVALENPETTLTDTLGEQVTPADDRVPDLVGRLRYIGDWGEASSSLLLREIRQDQATLSDGSTVLNNSDEQTSWGIGASASINTYGNDDLTMGVIFGEGVGRYLAGNAFNAGSIDNQGQIVLIASRGGYVAYRHWWNNQWRSSFVYSMAEADNNTSVTGSAVNKSANTSLVNLLWIPFENSLVGLEYGHLERKLENGQSGDIDKLYLRLSYDF